MAATPDLQKANARVLRNTLLVVAGMFAFGFALVPLYGAICTTFGINGQTENIEEARAAATQVDTSRMVRVQFHAIVNDKLRWTFAPVARELSVHPGEVRTVYYEARNVSADRIVGQAVHSVTPEQAASHFKKTECFCYRQQALQPGESRRMPVRFMIDPGLPKSVHEVTLTYTFFDATRFAPRDG